MTRDEDTALAEPIRAVEPDPSPLMAERPFPRGRDSRERNQRARRAGRAIPALIGGCLLLTAGAGTAAIAMSDWAGVSMPVGHIRNMEPIPLSWTTDSGHAEECRVWIELRNPDDSDTVVLDQAIKSRNWAGLGQHLYDTNIVDDQGDGEQRVADGLEPQVRKFVGEVFPGVAWLAGGTPGDKAVDAWGMTCAPDQNG